MKSHFAPDGEVISAFGAEFFKDIKGEARQHEFVLLIGDTSEDADSERTISGMLLLNQADGSILNTNGFLEGLLLGDAEGYTLGTGDGFLRRHKEIDSRRNLLY